MKHLNRLFLLLSWAIIFNLIFFGIASNAQESLEEVSHPPQEYFVFPIQDIPNDFRHANQHPMLELSTLPADTRCNEVTYTSSSENTNSLLIYQKMERFSRYTDTTLALVPIGFLAMDMILPAGGKILSSLSWLRNTFLFGTLSSGISSFFRWFNWFATNEKEKTDLNLQSLSLQPDPLNLQKLDIAGNTSFLLLYLTPLTFESYKVSPPLFAGMMIISSLFTFWTCYMIKDYINDSDQPSRS